MQIHELTSTGAQKKKKYVGRGGARGKNAGRGNKGQNSRAGRKKRPQMRDIIKKLPKLRGRGKNSNKPFRTEAAVVNLSLIEKNFDTGAKVSPSILLSKGFIRREKGVIPPVKILGTGELTKSVIISGCLVSFGAQTKIEKAGGSIR